MKQARHSVGTGFRFRATGRLGRAPSLITKLVRVPAVYLLCNNASAQTFAGQAMRFTDTKSETLNLRVSPTFKHALKEAADHEQRGMVNMLEVLLGDYCDSKGIVLSRSTTTRTPASKPMRSSRRSEAGAAAE